MSPRTLEHLLRDILGQGAIADDGDRQAIDAPLEATNEHHDCVALAQRNGGQQRLV